MIISTRLAKVTKVTAADLEGFAHSAAARPKSSDQVPAIAGIFLEENRQS